MSFREIFKSLGDDLFSVRILGVLVVLLGLWMSFELNIVLMSDLPFRFIIILLWVLFLLISMFISIIPNYRLNKVALLVFGIYLILISPVIASVSGIRLIYLVPLIILPNIWCIEVILNKDINISSLPFIGVVGITLLSSFTNLGYVLVILYTLLIIEIFYEINLQLLSIKKMVSLLFVISIISIIPVIINVKIPALEQVVLGEGVISTRVVLATATIILTLFIHQKSFYTKRIKNR